MANPSAKIFFTGGITTRTWGIRFDSTQYVSFIGSTTVGSYPITFEVDTTIGNPTRNVFQVIRSTNIRLEGLTIIGHRRYSDGSAATILNQTSFLGSTAINSDNTYKNLLVKRGSIGISLVGISNVLRDNNIIVSDCDFGGSGYIETFSSRGFQLLWVNNLTISKNNIRRAKNFPTATSGPVGIISFGGHNDLVISHNQIHDIEKYGATGGNAAGIILQTNGPGTYSNSKIFNNMIYDLRNPAGIVATLNTQGMQALAFSSTSPNSYGVVHIYNNTIHLTASLNPASTGWAGCMTISSAVAGDSIVSYNNIFSNEVKTTGSNSGTGIYADFVNSPTPKRVNSNRNLFWYPHLPLYWSTLSFFAGADLASWNASTSQDASSIEQSNPFFVSATDPHITPASLSAANNNASPVAFVTDDIDGNARSLTTPDLGADEYSGTSYTVAIQALIQGFYTDGNFDNNLYGTMIPDTVKVELHNATSPYSLVTSAKVVLDSSGYGVLQLGSWTPGNSYYFVLKHRNAVETWSKSGGELLNLTAAQYSFVDTAKSFGNNQVKKGVYWCIYSGDVNQDGVVDLTDVSTVDVDNLNFVTGYVVTDVNGDNLVDLSDLGLVDTNNLNFVSKVVPSKLLLRQDKSPIQTRLDKGI